MALEFKPLKTGRKFSEWVAGLKGKSGVYVIREKTNALVEFLELYQVLYIGESHTNRLASTLLRHFQHWKGKTAGHTFAESKVEIAIVRCPAKSAVSLQNAMIEEFRPKLNIVANPDAQP